MTKDRCPNCGATLTVDSVKKIRTCEYCGTTFSMADLTQTVRYIDEARLKEAELKEKMFQAEQEERAEHEAHIEALRKKEERSDKRKRIAALVLICIGFLANMASHSGAFVLFLIFAAMLFYSSRKKTTPDRSRREEQWNRYYDRNREYSDKDKMLAFLLCLFAGGLGGHYFYVGRIGKGILYLLTFGLFGIGLLIDLFIILSGKFKDANGKLLIK